MNGKFLIALCAAALAAATAAPGQAQAPDQNPALQSLRGTQPIDDASQAPENRQTIRPNKSIPRTFAQQPPLIPHAIGNFRIDRTENKCLTCHGGSDDKEPMATPISKSHYATADGAPSPGLSPARYFCTQCHVSQTDAAPLVGNEFQPGADTL